ncbi:MAG: DUF4184 family protein [Verrucomicrobia bacterium]|nr:MAG: DUF4184 family protein [Verrucomicrobiota bacterium]
MPFTISHAGFVLPLRPITSPHVLCGLVIGSIVPDFPYFVREFGVASFAHTVLGAHCVSLPVGLFVYFLVRLFFGRMADALPKPHSIFLSSWGLGKIGSKPNIMAIAVAILAGALFHNFVDSFTHQSGAAVSIFPVLTKEAISFGGQPLHAFRVLQYVGSVLGMVMIAAAYWSGLRGYCRAHEFPIWQDSQRWLFLTGLIIVTILAAAGLNAEFFPRGLDFYAARVFVFKFLITWLPIAGIAFLVFALCRRD